MYNIGIIYGLRKRIMLILMWLISCARNLIRDKILTTSAAQVKFKVHGFVMPSLMSDL